jgi:hypothetical protein
VNRPYLLTAIGFAIAAAAVGLALSLESEDERRVEVLPPPPPAPVVAPAAQPATSLVDIVRVSSGGDVVLAGRSDPGAAIGITITGQAHPSVTADIRGEWVFVPKAPLSPGLSEISLSSGPDRRATLLVAIRPALYQSAKVLVLGPAGDVTPLIAGDDQTRPVFMIDRDAHGVATLAGTVLPQQTIRATLANGSYAETESGPDGRWIIRGVEAGESQGIRVGITTEPKTTSLGMVELPPRASAGVYALSQPDALTLRIERPDGGATHLFLGDPGQGKP